MPAPLYRVLTGSIRFRKGAARAVKRDEDRVAGCARSVGAELGAARVLVELSQGCHRRCGVRTTPHHGPARPSGRRCGECTMAASCAVLSCPQHTHLYRIRVLTSHVATNPAYAPARARDAFCVPGGQPASARWRHQRECTPSPNVSTRVCVHVGVRVCILVPPYMLGVMYGDTLRLRFLRVYRR